MKKKLFFAAVALVALASCTSDDFIGDVTTPQDNSPSASDAIVFSSASQGSTRANKYGADAADALGNKFIVMGVKGNGTGTGQTTVFSNYLVEWAQNTAATTESNTSDWEYVGKGPQKDITGVNMQTIKYWDYSTTAYDFAAYSVGKGNTIITSGDVSAGKILASPINYGSATTAAYTLQGLRNDLTKCYITDMKTVAKTNYKQEVELQFRSLASKVRIALYETVPGYSVANVKFYSADQTRPINTTLASVNATLIGSAFYTGGTYTVSFPHIGSGNASDPDYNKAHVEMTTITDTESSQTFGELNYGSKELEEKTTTYTSFLKRSSQEPSFAKNGTYQTVLPKEDGTVLELCVDYTLVPIDGAEETITIYGAKAYVPAVYTKWMPNYAYTYIFKISDNTNGWTNPSNIDDDPAGLFPITFDAVVLDSEETGHQTTITTVATPSITTYQRGHVYSATNEYKASSSPDATAAKDNDAIYAQVMNNGALVTTLSSANSFFYEITNSGKKYSTKPGGWPTGYYTDPDCTTAASGEFSSATTYFKPCSEADVMDALNIQESATSSAITGRNGIVLTSATSDNTVTQIPGEDGNWITKYNNAGTPTAIAAGMVAKLSPTAAGTYAYVYDYTSTSPSPSATDIYTAVQLTGTAPADFTTKYYKKTGAETYELCEAGDYVADGYFYIKYQDRNHTYAVKVIKVQ